MSDPIGGSLPDEITLTRQEAALAFFAVDEAAEAAVGDLRSRLEDTARLIVEKLLPDLPDLPDL